MWTWYIRSIRCVMLSSTRPMYSTKMHYSFTPYNFHNLHDGFFTKGLPPPPKERFSAIFASEPKGSMTLHLLSIPIPNDLFGGYFTISAFISSSLAKSGVHSKKCALFQGIERSLQNWSKPSIIMYHVVLNELLKWNINMATCILCICTLMSKIITFAL